MLHPDRTTIIKMGLDQGLVDLNFTKSLLEVGLCNMGADLKTLRTSDFTVFTLIIVKMRYPVLLHINKHNHNVAYFVVS